MKGFALTAIIIFVGFIAVLSMVGFIFLKSSGTPTKPSSTANQSMQTTQVSPQVPVKDFAPNMSMSQKTTVVIQTSDSSDIKYIVPKNQVATYVKSLPPGYHVVSQSP